MRVAVIGLGYVGLPVALAFADEYPGTIGFDINSRRVKDLRDANDQTGEVAPDRLKSTTLRMTSDPADMAGADVYIVCVPTPVKKDRRPDLRPLESASGLVGRVMQGGAIVVYESTVYPGVTEDICGPILAKESGLKLGVDFKLGYSPERINPGDKEHTFQTIVKVVAGEDAETTETLARLYGSVVKAGVHRAPSIKVAEAAKVLENTQRDLNIALMNELAMICDLMGVRTKDVLDAAGTKWNFLKFSPGLVGGHCIGVDPYYLTSKAQELGYHPEVILSGRRVNDAMGAYVARRTLRLLKSDHLPLSKLKVGVLGITFKEDVPDVRNSKVPDIVAELETFGLHPLVADLHALPEEVRHEYGIETVPESELNDLDALILAVPHREYLRDAQSLFSRLKQGGAFVDVRSSVNPALVPAGIIYWSL